MSRPTLADLEAIGQVPADPARAKRRAGAAAQRAGAAAEAPVVASLAYYRAHAARPEGERTGMAACLRWAQPVARFERRRRPGLPPVMVPAGKSGPDVTGWSIIGGRPIAVVVEVKATAGPRLDLSAGGAPRIDSAQRADLAAAAQAGAVAGVLARIDSPKVRGERRGPPRWYFIPWPAFAEAEVAALDAGGASIPAAALDALVDRGRAARLAERGRVLDWLPAACALCCPATAQVSPRRPPRSAPARRDAGSPPSEAGHPPPPKGGPASLGLAGALAFGPSGGW